MDEKTPEATAWMVMSFEIVKTVEPEARAAGTSKLSVVGGSET
jgi:hypothetical protein